MPTEGEEVTHKSHRERIAGRKADKKKLKKNKEKKEKNQLPTDKPKNPKAFTFNSAVKAERRFRRKQDLDAKKTHIPLIDRTPLEPPPILVAVVGPAKVGKTLVIQCLIKSYTRQPMSNIAGPVTVVSGKKRRITFMECNNDINSMIDIAKVADLVLLLIDASFGFEMEVFEFLNICQVHGMPRIMGVLTHLDKFSNVKHQRKTKKMLKHRFWTEVYAGAKLFYLSGQIHGEYLRNEIKNLARFISVMKFRPLTWRTSHPYMLADRLEDLTDPEQIRLNSKVDRTISLYGYIRGVPLIKESSVHIPGCGDCRIKDVCFLPDPCPRPELLKKRALVEKERLIYAPFSGVGGIVYDKDAVYVELGGSHWHKSEDDGLILNMIDSQTTLDAKLERSELKLFSESEAIQSKDVKEVFGEGFNVENVFDDGRIRRKVIFDDEKQDNDDSNEDDDEEDDSDDINDADSDEELLGNDEEIVGVKRKISKAGNAEKSGKKKKNGDEGNLEAELDQLKVPNDDNNDEDEEDHEDDAEEVGSNDENTDDDDDEEAMGGQRKVLVVRNAEKSAQKKRKHDDDELEAELAALRAQNADNKAQKTKKQSKEQIVYRDLAKYPDKEVKKQISEVLESFDMSSERKKSKNKAGSDSDVDDESFDELSDDDFDDKMDQDDEDEEDDQNDENNDEDVNDDNNDKSDAEEDENLKWKQNLAQKAREAFLNRRHNTVNLMKLVYGVSEARKDAAEAPESKKDDPEAETDDVGGIFRVVSEQQKAKLEERELKNLEDSIFYTKDPPRNWLAEESKLLLLNRFVTGKWKESEDAEELLKLDDLPDDLGDDEVFGDFEDLETGQKVKAASKGNAKPPKEMTADELEEKTKLLEKKRKLKQQFDAEYDDSETKTYYDDLKEEVEKQAQLNKSEFEGLDDDLRVQLEGFRPGMYIRIEFEKIPCELITNFDPSYPLIVGGLLHGEENVGFVQCRIKKHRWYSKILKTRDPQILSVGWRRFQTLPIFSKLEDNMRHRMLKYTPEHVACMAHFWGPITPQGTGVLAIQENSLTPGFRITATGSIVELDKSTRIVKKLKLTGVPLKIYKKTAFIKDMFNSSLEVAKFEGAKIKTVSGIRGQIKKAVNKPEGCFRATFEDKIVLSDIVFCRTWYKVDVPKFYNPVNSLLLPIEAKNQWKGMKTTGQLKREKGIRVTPNQDSLYTPIKRKPKVFKPVTIPASLQKELPFRDKPKIDFKKQKFGHGRIPVIRDEQEESVAKLMKMIRVAYHDKQQKMKQTMNKRMTEHSKVVEAEEMKKLKRQKELKKQIHRTLSKMDAKEKRKKR